MAKQEQPLIRNISDTALWVAVHRARESERQDALFKDPFARKLAGDRGEQIAKGMQAGMGHEWPYTARTVRFDQIVAEQIKQGTDMVINLATGLDTRPYRMELPSSLQWIEVDFPVMIDYKEKVLAGETPRCALERVRLDLSDMNGRRALRATKSQLWAAIWLHKALSKTGPLTFAPPDCSRCCKRTLVR